MVVLAAGATTFSSEPRVSVPAPSPWEPELPQIDAPANTVQFGLASWYGEWHHGRETATGEPFDQWAMTAAHPTLPFGSEVDVTNLVNGRTVRVRINDRGPVVGNRVLDLSRGAATRIGAIGAGVVRVRLRVVDPEPAPAVAATTDGPSVRRASSKTTTPAVRRASSTR